MNEWKLNRAMKMFPFLQLLLLESSVSLKRNTDSNRKLILRLQQLKKQQLLVFILVKSHLIFFNTLVSNPAGIFLLRVNNGKAETMYDTYTKLTIKTLDGVSYFCKKVAVVLTSLLLN